MSPLNVLTISKHAIERFPNEPLGRNIMTNAALLKSEKLSKFVNNATMSALDNYAKHENLSIYITPLENDLFEDVSVSVFKKDGITSCNNFALKIEEGREGVVKFFRELYTRVAQSTKGLKE
jgi:hypothetical protein